MDNQHEPKWLDTRAVAERYGVSEATVRWWRQVDTGPKAHKFGKHVRYGEADLRAYEAEGRQKAAREVIRYPRKQAGVVVKNSVSPFAPPQWSADEMRAIANQLRDPRSDLSLILSGRPDPRKGAGTEPAQ